MKARQHLMRGPLGAGELMLARRSSTIPPDLTLSESIETTRIPNEAYLAGGRTPSVTTRPIRTPYRTSSDMGTIARVPLEDVPSSLGTCQKILRMHGSQLMVDPSLELEAHPFTFWLRLRFGSVIIIS